MPSNPSVRSQLLRTKRKATFDNDPHAVDRHFMSYGYLRKYCTTITNVYNKITQTALKHQTDYKYISLSRSNSNLKPTLSKEK